MASLGPLVKLLQAPSPVVHSYAALCLERILTVKSASAGGVLAYVLYCFMLCYLSPCLSFTGECYSFS